MPVVLAPVRKSVNLEVSPRIVVLSSFIVTAFRLLHPSNILLNITYSLVPFEGTFQLEKSRTGPVVRLVQPENMLENISSVLLS